MSSDVARASMSTLGAELDTDLDAEGDAEVDAEVGAGAAMMAQCSS